MTIGIYKLVFNGTDKVYIGQSVDIERRFSAHLLSFKKRTASTKLLKAYQEYGIPKIVFVALCNKEYLNIYENILIKLYSSYINGFNGLEHAEDLPNRHTNNNGSSLLIFTKKQVLDAFSIFINNPILSMKEISDKANISIGMVAAMIEGRNYIWLADIDPINYSKYISNRGHGNSAQSKGIVYPDILSPDNIVYTVTNRSAFAKEHNLDCGALGRVLRKVAKSHKGWKLA